MMTPLVQRPSAQTNSGATFSAEFQAAGGPCLAIGRLPWASTRQEYEWAHRSIDAICDELVERGMSQRDAIALILAAAEAWHSEMLAALAELG